MEAGGGEEVVIKNINSEEKDKEKDEEKLHLLQLDPHIPAGAKLH